MWNKDRAGVRILEYMETRVEFLYWQECSSYDLALQRLREVLAERQVAEPVRLIEVTTEQQAESLRFPGSPTIRIDGQDLFPVPEGPYGLTCRVYHTDDGRVTPLPTTEMMRRALRRLVDNPKAVRSQQSAVRSQIPTDDTSQR